MSRLRGREGGWERERWSKEEIETTDHLFCMFGEQIPKSYSGFCLFSFQSNSRALQTKFQQWDIDPNTGITYYLNKNVESFSLFEISAFSANSCFFIRLDQSFNFMHRRLQFQSRSGLTRTGRSLLKKICPLSTSMDSENVFEKSFELLLALNFRLKVLVGRVFWRRKNKRALQVLRPKKFGL